MIVRSRGCHDPDKSPAVANQDLVRKAPRMVLAMPALKEPGLHLPASRLTLPGIDSRFAPSQA